MFGKQLPFRASKHTLSLEAYVFLIIRHVILYSLFIQKCPTVCSKGNHTNEVHIIYSRWASARTMFLTFSFNVSAFGHLQLYCAADSDQKEAHKVFGIPRMRCSPCSRWTICLPT